jgi:hypothetical protein
VVPVRCSIIQLAHWQSLRITSRLAAEESLHLFLRPFADYYPLPAHNQTMNNVQSRAAFYSLFPVPCFSGTPPSPPNIFFGPVSLQIISAIYDSSLLRIAGKMLQVDLLSTT